MSHKDGRVVLSAWVEPVLRDYAREAAKAAGVQFSLWVEGAVQRAVAEESWAGVLLRQRTALHRIAVLMQCEPDDDDDLTEAVRLLVSERNEARAEVKRLQERVATQDVVLRYGEQVCARLVTERDQALEQARLGKMVASRVQAERDDALAHLTRLRVELRQALDGREREYQRAEQALTEVERLRASLQRIATLMQCEPDDDDDDDLVEAVRLLVSERDKLHAERRLLRGRLVESLPFIGVRPIEPSRIQLMQLVRDLADDALEEVKP